MPGLPVYVQYTEYNEPLFHFVDDDGAVRVRVFGVWTMVNGALKPYTDESAALAILILYREDVVRPSGTDHWYCPFDRYVLLTMLEMNCVLSNRASVT